jgi:DNA-binding GntR family transcriptional regulator
LNIKDLAKHYGTSIAPVRDALQMLGQDGLITIKNRSGYFVGQNTVQELCDLFDLREILEAAAVQRAATRISAEQIEQLVHDYASYDDESYDRYIDENRHFHCLIAEASGNQELTQMLGHVHDRLARFMYLVFRHSDKTQEQTHARIIAALRVHDAEAALKAMLNEIRATREDVLARVMQEQGALWPIGYVEPSPSPYSYQTGALGYDERLFPASASRSPLG